MYPTIKDGPFGAEHSEEGEWNCPYITIHKDMKREVEYPHRIIDQGTTHNSYIPKQRGGCMGLLEMDDGTWHYLGEDDDHYWTEAILERGALPDLCDLLEFYNDRIEVEIDYIKAASTQKYPKGTKEFSRAYTVGNFVASVKHRQEGSSPLILITHKGTEITMFDAGHLPARVAVLKEAVKYTTTKVTQPPNIILKELIAFFEKYDLTLSVSDCAACLTTRSCDGKNLIVFDLDCSATDIEALELQEVLRGKL